MRHPIGFRRQVNWYPVSMVRTLQPPGWPRPFPFGEAEHDSDAAQFLMLLYTFLLLIHFIISHGHGILHIYTWLNCHDTIGHAEIERYFIPENRIIF